MFSIYVSIFIFYCNQNGEVSNLMFSVSFVSYDCSYVFIFNYKSVCFLRKMLRKRLGHNCSIFCCHCLGS